MEQVVELAILYHDENPNVSNSQDECIIWSNCSVVLVAT
jgi:hypothetical protein